VNVFPSETYIHSANLNNQILYLGFSRQGYVDSAFWVNLEEDGSDTFL
jgi:hypothetical protein